MAQSRSWMPHGFAALLWFGVDDSATTVHFPIHGGATRIPAKFAGAGAQDGVSTYVKCTAIAYEIIANDTNSLSVRYIYSYVLCATHCMLATRVLVLAVWVNQCVDIVIMADDNVMCNRWSDVVFEMPAVICVVLFVAVAMKPQVI